jgi:hypothetical protein
MLERETIIPAANRTELDQVGKWIVQLYQDWGKPKQAAEWQQKINAAKRPAGY